MAEAQGVLQRFHVAFAVPQLLDEADAVRVRKHGKQCGQFLRDENSMRHCSSPCFLGIQTFEYDVMGGGTVGKSFREITKTVVEVGEEEFDRIFQGGYDSAQKPPEAKVDGRIGILATTYDYANLPSILGKKSRDR